MINWQNHYCSAGCVPSQVCNCRSYPLQRNSAGSNCLPSQKGSDRNARRIPMLLSKCLTLAGSATLSLQCPLGVGALGPELPRPVRRRLRSEPPIRIRLRRSRLDVVFGCDCRIGLVFVEMRCSSWQDRIVARRSIAPHAIDSSRRF